MTEIIISAIAALSITVAYALGRYFGIRDGISEGIEEGIRAASEYYEEELSRATGMTSAEREVDKKEDDNEE